MGKKHKKHKAEKAEWRSASATAYSGKNRELYRAGGGGGSSIFVSGDASTGGRTRHPFVGWAGPELREGKALVWVREALGTGERPGARPLMLSCRGSWVLWGSWPTGNERSGWWSEGDYVDKPLEKPLKLVLKVGGSEVTELSGSGHDSSYYDDRSDHERERHKEKKKKKKKKSEKEKEKHLDDEERRKRKEEKKRKREKEQCDTEGETDDFDPGKKVEVEPPPDRPVRACRTQP
ncbi:PREDICTED: bromodomain-containing protein 9, partial [Nestor notabilis]|uniref:bromodomain-containing protein 9 n=1 Tax=Nestor notabilis TaxID=176057 RepID=UPI0005234C2D